MSTKSLLVVVVTSIFTSVSAYQIWTDPETGLTWTYVIENNKATVGGGSKELTAISADISQHIRIPSFINGIQVVGIGDYAFYLCKRMPSVEIPNGVTNIGKGAFCECYKLASAILPEGVADLKENTFDRCLVLTSISIPTTVTNIGDFAFASTSLLEIEVPNGVKTIGADAFAWCFDLIDVKISGSVYSIGDSAFQQCHEISSLKIEDGVKCIGSGAFQSCEKLTTVELPPSVCSVGDHAFVDCSRLSTVVLHEGLEDLGCGTFSGCGELTSITIPSTVDILRNDLFYKCDKLSSVTIKAGVTELSGEVFYHCYGLKMIVLPPSIESLTSSTFRECPNLTSIYFRGNAPSGPNGEFENVSDSMVVYVAKGSTGWNGRGSTSLPSSWHGHAIVYGDPEDAEIYTSYDVVFTKANPPNQHWMTNSTYVMPRFIGWKSSKDGRVYRPGQSVENIANAGEKVVMEPVWGESRQVTLIRDVGCVVAMTEVRSSGAVSIPTSWTNGMPGFIERYGNDLGVAAMKTTGKKDGDGNEMRVWQDYVAGTDPTDENDRFTASIALEGGKPIVSYTPELSDAEKAKRVYTTYGKVGLQDVDWVEVAPGSEADYNFFKVTVEMK